MRYKRHMDDARLARRRRLWQLGGVAVVCAFAIAIAIAIGSSHNPPRLRPGRPVPGSAKTLALFASLPQSADALGNPRAPVTLVEFADLQCPFCAQVARDALPTLVRRYVRTGRLLLIFENLDFLGSDSVRAARMAAALGRQQHLWQFLDLFYVNQRTENTGYADDDFLRALAGVIPGVDVPRALSDRNAPAVQATIAAATAEAKRVGIRSTPSFLLGRTGQPLNRFFPEALDAGSFTGAVDRVLAGRSA
jgi:protein-disulfide isomerase